MAQDVGVMPNSAGHPPTATVIGGGPGGLIAAEVLAGAGVQVTVYEHMASVGRKFQLAGRGGLNLTHSEPLEQLLGRYGPARPRLEAAIRAFDPAALRHWSAGLGQPTFVGSSGRVFPESFRATPLLRAWLARLGELGVSVEVRHRWLGWGRTPDGAIDPQLSRLRRVDGSEFEVAADLLVLALGGASWPRVGADGSWVESVTDAGVEVSPLRPANCGVLVDWSSEFVDRFDGVPVKNVIVDVAGVPVRGELMVTAGGIEGGPIYAQSASIRQQLDRDRRCRIVLDLHPDRSVDDLAERLAGRRAKESTSHLLRRAAGLTPVAIGLLREATANDLPPDAAGLAALIKSTPVVVASTMPIDRAISTAGGIALDEVDERFMLRRLPGTFVVGEMLDWEAPTGGYLLQAAFSTGVAAARGAVDWLASVGADRG